MRRASGYILISTVLFLLAFSVTLVLSTLAFSLGSTGRSLAIERGAVALALADGCMEEALFRIRANTEYDDESIDMAGVACEVSVERSADSYQVTAQVTANGHMRRVVVEVRRGAERLELASWLVQ